MGRNTISDRKSDRFVCYNEVAQVGRVTALPWSPIVEPCEELFGEAHIKD